MVRKKDTVVTREGGITPTDRAHHKWTARSKRRLLGGHTILKFSCRGSTHEIKLNGVLIDKNESFIEMPKARIVRQSGDRFFVLVDLKEHGVNKLSRKRGGYYLWTIGRNKSATSIWEVERFYYSEKHAKEAGATPNLLFHNVLWRVVKHCYYGVVIKDDDGGDNSS